MKLKILFLITFILLPSFSYASDKNVKNLDGLTKIIHGLDKQDLSEEKKCEIIWNTLWPEVKNNNLAAKLYLYFFLVPLPHMDSIKMPGTENFVYDAAVLALHTLKELKSKYFKENEINNLDYSYLLLFLSDEGLRKAFPEEDAKIFEDEYLLKCLAMKGIIQQSANECFSSAIKNGPFPTFEEYITTIDQRIASGKKPVCTFDNYGGKVR